MARGDGSVRGGLRYVRANPAVGLLLLATAGLGFGTDPVNTLTPSLVDRLGGGEELVGLLVSAFGFGAVAMTVVVGRVARRLGHTTAGAVGLAGLAVGMIALALAPSLTAAAAALVLAGAGFLLGVTGLTTALQRLVPEGLRGRVMALWSVAFLGSRPIAALIDGTVADLSSPAAGVLVAAGFAAGAALLARHPRLRA